MKLKKKSGLMGAVIALSCASLISVGFASWVISQGDDQTVNGTIVVDTVETKDYKLQNWTKVTGNNLDDKIIFGVDTSSWSGSPWLTNTGTIGNTSETSVCNLTASFTFKISNVDDATIADNVATLKNGGQNVGYKLTATFTDTGYSDALTNGLEDNEATPTNYKNLVGALPTPTLSVSGGVFTWSVTFTWGQGFGGKNPYQYFNEKENNVTNAAEAVSKLTALSKLVASYSVRLVVAAAV